MASKTSRPESDQTVIDMAELSARIARLRAELGITDADIPAIRASAAQQARRPC
jgi:uncharacterized small protein (DUF1192 family)